MKREIVETVKISTKKMYTKTEINSIVELFSIRYIHLSQYKRLMGGETEKDFNIRILFTLVDENDNDRDYILDILDTSNECELTVYNLITNHPYKDIPRRLFHGKIEDGVLYLYFTKRETMEYRKQLFKSLKSNNDDNGFESSKRSPTADKTIIIDLPTTRSYSFSEISNIVKILNDSDEWNTYSHIRMKPISLPITLVDDNDNKTNYVVEILRDIFCNYHINVYNGNEYSRDLSNYFRKKLRGKYIDKTLMLYFSDEDPNKVEIEALNALHNSLDAQCNFVDVYLAKDAEFNDFALDTLACLLGADKYNKIISLYPRLYITYEIQPRFANLTGRLRFDDNCIIRECYIKELSIDSNDTRRVGYILKDEMNGSIRIYIVNPTKSDIYFAHALRTQICNQESVTIDYKYTIPNVDKPVTPASADNKESNVEKPADVKPESINQKLEPKEERNTNIMAKIAKIKRISELVDYLEKAGYSFIRFNKLDEVNGLVVSSILYVKTSEENKYLKIKGDKDMIRYMKYTIDKRDFVTQYIESGDQNWCMVTFDGDNCITVK